MTLQKMRARRRNRGARPRGREQRRPAAFASRTRSPPVAPEEHEVLPRRFARRCGRRGGGKEGMSTERVAGSGRDLVEADRCPGERLVSLPIRVLAPVAQMALGKTVRLPMPGRSWGVSATATSNEKTSGKRAPEAFASPSM